MNKKGYTLPEVVPEDLACYRIWIPNCLEALLAVKGSLFFLGKYVAYEKTGDNRAVEMGQAFKRGDIISWLPCDNEEEMCTCDEIRNIIREEINAMTINIYNGSCGCGCGGSSGGGGVPEPPPDSIPLPTPPPSEPLPTTDEYLDYNCRLSNYIVDSFIDVTTRFKNLWIGSSITIEGIITVINAVPVLQPYYVFTTQLLGYLVAISSSGVFDQLIELFTLHRDALVCILHEAESPASAEENLQNAIMGYTVYPYGVRIIAWVITEFLPFSTVFVEDAVDIPTTYNDATCCDEIIPDPSPSGLYFLINDPDEDAADASVLYGLTNIFGDGINITYYVEYAAQGQVIESGGFRVAFGFVDSLGAPTPAHIQVTAAYQWTGVAGGDYAVVGFLAGVPTNLADLVPGLPYTPSTAYDFYWFTKLGTDVPPNIRLKFRVMP